MLKPVIRFGSTGSAVVEAQTKLNNFGPSQLPQLKQKKGMLEPDGLFYGNTHARVEEFQRSKGLEDDGIVGSNTWRELDKTTPVTPPGKPPGKPPVVTPKLPPLTVPPTLPSNALRAKIITLAFAEKGLVTDKQTQGTITTKAAGPMGERKNWQRLKEYCDKGMAQPPPWSNPASLPFTASDNITYRITQLEGIKCHNMRVPLFNRGADGKPVGGRWNGLQWCGVFAAFILAKAGLNVKAHKKGGFLEIHPTIGAKDPQSQGQVKKFLTLVTPNVPIEPGDVCVLASQSHHVIVTDVQGDDVFTIAGNELFQEVATNKRKRSEIMAVYRVAP